MEPPKNWTLDSPLRWKTILFFLIPVVAIPITLFSYHRTRGVFPSPASFNFWIPLSLWWFLGAELLLILEALRIVAAQAPRQTFPSHPTSSLQFPEADNHRACQLHPALRILALFVFGLFALLLFATILFGIGLVSLAYSDKGHGRFPYERESDLETLLLIFYQFCAVLAAIFLTWRCKPAYRNH